MSVTPITEITARELSILKGASSALDIEETSGGALHLRAHQHGREWIVESDIGQLFLDVKDDSSTHLEIGWMPISDRLRYFASHLDRDEVTLSLADDRTVVVGDGTVMAAIDLVPQIRPEPQPLHFHPTASVSVTMYDFVNLMMTARSLPTGVSNESLVAPLPPMWMEAAEESLGLHVDWTEHGAPRATYRIAATSGSGHFTVSVPHGSIDRFLRIPPTTDAAGEELQLTFSVGHARDGDEERSALRLDAGDWQLILWLTHPLEERWATAVERVLGDDPAIEVVDRDHIEWLVTHERSEVRILLHHGQPDIARVSAVLVNGIDETLELLRELSQLNAASSGVRYWFDEQAVWAVCDVRCTELTSLTAAVRDVAVALRTYAPMLGALAASPT